MKDWKTYAVVALAAWCAYLTWRVTPSVVWCANYDQEYNGRRALYWWWGRNYREAERDGAGRSGPSIHGRKDGPTDAGRPFSVRTWLPRQSVSPGSPCDRPASRP